MTPTPLNDLEFALLNNWQRDFPLTARPYQAIADRLGSTETEVMMAYQRLLGSGHISRIGAVFRPHTLGWSTLAAVSVAEDRVEWAATRINAHPEVNHNYEREHRWNLWFVVAAANQAEVARVLAEIGRTVGSSVLDLPMVEDYHIDLGFDLNGCRNPHRVNHSPITQPVELDACDRSICTALEPGLSVTSHPYAAMAALCQEAEADILERIAHLQDSGVIRRFGVIVRHRELGYTANAMVVWNIPDAHVTAAGHTLGADAAVTLCYQRPRRLPDWPYNLFSMVHGRDRTAVLAEITRLRTLLGLGEIDCVPLFSQRRFKQCGARYGARHCAGTIQKAA
jgi:DNA-binding Lrp family transcriptional regulator